jgi:hypothetical protein
MIELGRRVRHVAPSRKRDPHPSVQLSFFLNLGDRHGTDLTGAADVGSATRL